MEIWIPERVFWLGNNTNSVGLEGILILGLDHIKSFYFEIIRLVFKFFFVKTKRSPDHPIDFCLWPGYIPLQISYNYFLYRCIALGLRVFVFYIQQNFGHHISTHTRNGIFFRFIYVGYIFYAYAQTAILYWLPLFWYLTESVLQNCNNNKVSHNKILYKL